MCVMCIVPTTHCSYAIRLLLYMWLACVCADRRPPGPGSCLPHGGRGGRLQCATNSPHTWHRLPLLLLQLPLRPQPAAAKTQTGLCSCHESQSCCSTYEGVYFFFLTKEFILKKIYRSMFFALPNLCFRLFQAAVNPSLPEIQTTC